jgi:D-inositol-3-phosphate glycosyltransferase
MHLIFLSPHSDPLANLGEADAGGQCVYQHELARSLSHHHRIPVTVYTRQTGVRPAVSRINKRYYIKRITCGEVGFIPKEEIAPVLDEFVQKVAADVVLLKDPLLHAHYWDGALAGLKLIATLNRNVPMVFTPHSLAALKKHKFSDKKAELKYNFIPRITWERYAMLASGKTVVSSATERQALISQYQLSKRYSAIVEPGLSVERLKPIDQKSAREQLGLPLEGKIILSLGRITPSKQYEHALRGLAKIRLQEPVYFVICGGSAGNPKSSEEAEYFRYLKKVVSLRKLKNRVIFLPSISYQNVNLAYSSADLFLATAANEPFGLTILEAMASGLPVIASESAGAAIHISHAKTGFKIDTGNSGLLSRTIENVLLGNGLIQRLAANGQRYVHQQFNWKTKSAQFLKIYHQVMEANPSFDFLNLLNTNHFLKLNLSAPAPAVYQDIPIGEYLQLLEQSHLGNDNPLRQKVH